MATFVSWGDRLPTLEGPRIILRQLEESDVPALYSIYSNQEVMRYWSSLPLRHADEARQLFEQSRASYVSRTALEWGIVRRADDEIIGTCCLFHLNEAHRRAEVGFALARRHWGQGLMAESLATLLRFAFDVLGLHRIEADVDPNNHRSIRTLERQGFVREGYLRQRWHVGGEIQDGLFFGLLRGQWQAPSDETRSIRS